MSSSDHDRDSIERRLDAVERALSEDEPLDRTERLDDLDARLTELEAAVQALRGYVGSVRAVNEDIEHQADLALRKANALERHLAPVDAADGVDIRTEVPTESRADTASATEHDTGEEGDDSAGTPLGRLRDRL